MKELLSEIRSCKVCEPHLELGANPVLRASKSSKVLIVGQAPGTRVHKTAIPWNDPSGDQLRIWMDLTKEKFYNEDIFAIVPMGFCYPGKGRSGDLPPRKECAPLWHDKLFKKMSNLELILLIGMYAQDYYLKSGKKLTENVRAYKEFLPKYLPLPHPSPRNRLWLKKNPWFEDEVVSELRLLIKKFI